MAELFCVVPKACLRWGLSWRRWVLGSSVTLPASLHSHPTFCPLYTTLLCHVFSLTMHSVQECESKQPRTGSPTESKQILPPLSCFHQAFNSVIWSSPFSLLFDFGLADGLRFVLLCSPNCPPTCSPPTSGPKCGDCR